MKKVFFCFVLTIFGLGACVSDSQLKQLDPYYVFHENNSKVWLIDHLYKDNMDHAPISTVYKEVMIFHKNKVCCVYKLKEIGEKKGKKADFTLDATEKEMRFIFHNERWIFELILVSHNKIILRPKNGSKFLYTIELIPLPEF